MKLKMMKDLGLKKGLQHILDPYTQQSLFKCIKNYGLHATKYKFDITKTMSIADYVYNAYKTEPLWFYGMSYILNTNKSCIKIM